MKIVTIIGARPQFIKAAALSRAIKDYPEIKEVILHTGQHHDASMSDVFFEEMGIPYPDYRLEINGLSHGAMTGRMLEKIEEVLLFEKPDWVVVFGDTNTTIAGALAATKIFIPVAHVEAGIRSFNMRMPEEINRILTDRISTLLFCPTESAIQHLKEEGIKKGIVKTGDIMADALFYYLKSSSKKAKTFQTPPVGKFILATIHRAENTDDPEVLKGIVSALEKLNEQMPVYLPLHPRTSKKLQDLGISLKLHKLDPLGYLDMLQLLNHCSLVLTDSGGLQKEAYLCSKPCVTFRTETEWVELVEHGVNKVVGTSTEAIFNASIEFLKTPPKFPLNLYGEGRAAHEIVQEIIKYKK